ncbi:MAG: hypothetical protein QG597_4245 [Actinomycetota bacterium]|nr:hypothetical protein [Actinomycetota bacterium]
MGSPPEPDDLAGFTVPDDASALDSDRWRYYEELSARGDVRHSPDHPQDVGHPARWRDGLPWFGTIGHRLAPMAFLAAAVFAMFASLMLASVTRPDAPTATAPLALETSPVGTVGGLLPSAAVGVNGSARLLRDIRPAVIAVLDTGTCGSRCAATLEWIASQAEAAKVRMIVAGPGSIPRDNGRAGPEDSAPLPRVPLGTVTPDAETGEVTFTAAADQIGAVTMTAPLGTFDEFTPAGVTILVVAPDGRVVDVVRNADPSVNITTSLGQATASAP